MTQYTNYEFYKNTYKGNMPESDFNKLVIAASYEVRKNIFNRDVTDYEYDIQMATCAVANILEKIEQLENKKVAAISDKMLKSENVDGYSRTFETTTAEDIDAQITNQKKEIKEELKKYLLHTGLLHRGI